MLWLLPIAHHTPTSFLLPIHALASITRRLLTLSQFNSIVRKQTTRYDSLQELRMNMTLEPSSILTMMRDTSASLLLVHCHIDNDIDNGDHDIPLYDIGCPSSEKVTSVSTLTIAHSEVLRKPSPRVEDGSISEKSCKASLEICEQTPGLHHPSMSKQVKRSTHDNPELEMGDNGNKAGNVLPFPRVGDTTTAISTTYVKHKCATETNACAEVRVGWNGHISRWCAGSVLTYVVDEESFPAPAAMHVKEAMSQATCMWKGIDVSFKEVNHNDEPTFFVRYDPSRRRNTYALSFFPDESPGDLFVYELSLSNTTYLANILAHELGHILGLRHEFAHKKSWELKQPCVLFGQENSRSIMNYYPDLAQLQVSEQDLKEIKALYAYGQKEYKGLPIYDYDPNLHTRISHEESRNNHLMRKSGRRFHCRSVLRRVGSRFLRLFTRGDLPAIALPFT